MGDYLTENQICEWLKISRSTAVRLRKEGMPFIKLGKAVRYDKDKVQEWLDKRTHK
jgi:excisionase family DNA binding protein